MIVLFLLICANTHSITQRILQQRYKYREEFTTNHYQGLPDQWFEQKVDHFDATSITTFKQRFWINNTFYNGGGPVFLCIGGEGPAMSGYYLDYIFANAVELAPSENALILMLEHRYYGRSVPTEDLTTPNMKWASSHQALADIGAFRAGMTEKLGLPNDAKWISYGGSYPGMLSGWSRLKNPDAIHGAVASSAPVLAEVNMVGYMDTYGDSLRETDIGGSDECYKAIFNGHLAVGELMRTTEGQQQLEKQFNFCDNSNLESLQDKQAFAGFGVISIDVQNNDPACTRELCDIGKICSAMLNETNGETFVDRLSYISSKQNSNDCVDLHSQPDYVANTTISDHSWIRVWTYQTCAEFGYYQTCEVGSRCPFTQGLLTLDVFINDCVRAFGITQAMVEQNVAFSNAFYGGNEPEGSNVIWPNGSVDPWHNLSVLEPPNVFEDTIMVPGACHCQWMRTTRETDSVALKYARQEIQSRVLSWLKE